MQLEGISTATLLRILFPKFALGFIPVIWPGIAGPHETG